MTDIYLRDLKPEVREEYEKDIRKRAGFSVIEALNTGTPDIVIGESCFYFIVVE